jgi:hypothetical protein
MKASILLMIKVMSPVGVSLVNGVKVNFHSLNTHWLLRVSVSLGLSMVSSVISMVVFEWLAV